MDNLNGYAISIEMYHWIKDNIPKGKTILEFGSGTGTIELAKDYKVISIEHDKNYIGLAKKANYYHAPLINGWYDVDVVNSAIKNKEIALIIIDGPPGEGNRNGIISFIRANLDLFKKAKIIVDDTNRHKEQLLAEEIAKLVGRNNTTIKGFEKSFNCI